MSSDDAPGTLAAFFGAAIFGAAAFFTGNGATPCNTSGFAPKTHPLDQAGAATNPAGQLIGIVLGVLCSLVKVILSNNNLLILHLTVTHILSNYLRDILTTAFRLHITKSKQNVKEWSSFSGLFIFFFFLFFFSLVFISK